MRKLCAIFLVLALLTTSVFASKPSDWAVDLIDEQMVDFLTGIGVSVDYQRAITREEFAILAFNLYNRMYKEGLPESIEITNPFTDVNNPIVLFSYYYKIVKGVSETEFAPDKTITREEICVMLSRVINKGDITFSNETLESLKGTIDVYDDKNEVSDWALPHVEYALKNGIMKGVSETMISPKSECTIEQAIILCSRLLSANAN